MEMQMELSELKSKLRHKLGREVEIEEIRPGQWMVPYYNFNLKGRGEFVGDTPEEACKKLISYLNHLDIKDEDLGDTNANRTDPPSGG